MLFGCKNPWNLIVFGSSRYHHFYQIIENSKRNFNFKPWKFLLSFETTLIMCFDVHFNMLGNFYSPLLLTYYPITNKGNWKTDFPQYFNVNTLWYSCICCWNFGAIVCGSGYNFHIKISSLSWSKIMFFVKTRPFWGFLGKQWERFL